MVQVLSFLVCVLRWLEVSRGFVFHVARLVLLVFRRSVYDSVWFGFGEKKLTDPNNKFYFDLVQFDLIIIEKPNQSKLRFSVS